MKMLSIVERHFLNPNCSVIRIFPSSKRSSNRWFSMEVKSLLGNDKRIFPL